MRSHVITLVGERVHQAVVLVEPVAIGLALRLSIAAVAEKTRMGFFSLASTRSG